MLLYRAVNDVSELLLCRRESDFKVEELCGIASVNKAEILRDGLVEYQSTERSVDYARVDNAVDLSRNSDLNGSMNSEVTVFVSHHGFVEVAIETALALFARTVDSQVVRTENHVLRRNCYGFTVGRLEEVVCREHEESRLCLRLARKRNVNRHLVAVEVRVERGTYERVKLYRSAFNEYRLERLNGQAVKSRSSVEQHGVILYYVFKSVPYFGADSFNLLLCVLDVRRVLRLDKALHNERLEELECHFLRKSALINLERRTDNDNGTT